MRVSWQMRVLALYFKGTRKRKMATREAAIYALAQPKGSSAPPKKFATHYDVNSSELHGFTTYTVSPKEGAQRIPGAVIYLHGGSYINEIKPQHWSLIAEIVDSVGATVHVPIFGLAPAHHAELAVEFVTGLIATLDPDEPLHLAGDSSGGGLALAVALAQSPTRQSSLAGLTLIAPFLDVTLSNPEIDAIEPTDPWLSSVGLRVAGEAWADELALDDPRVSPIHGDFESLPPIAVFVGTRDIFVPDCRRLRDRLPSDRLIYREWPGALHDYPLLPVPEGRRGAREVVTNIRGSLTARR